MLVELVLSYLSENLITLSTISKLPAVSSGASFRLYELAPNVQSSSPVDFPSPLLLILRSLPRLPLRYSLIAMVDELLSH